jgi:hypothetical protein
LSSIANSFTNGRSLRKREGRGPGEIAAACPGAGDVERDDGEESPEDADRGTCGWESERERERVGERARARVHATKREKEGIILSLTLSLALSLLPLLSTLVFGTMLLEERRQ